MHPLIRIITSQSEHCSNSIKCVYPQPKNIRFKSPASYSTHIRRNNTRNKSIKTKNLFKFQTHISFDSNLKIN